MNDETVQSRRAECANIIAQAEHAEELRDAGLITPEAFAAMQGRKLACLRVSSLLDAGEWVDDDRFLQIVAEEVASVDLTTLGRLSESMDALADLSEVVSGSAVDVADLADAVADLSDVVSDFIGGGE